MPNFDVYEREVLTAYEKGSLKSLATRAELAKFRAAARATAVNDKPQLATGQSPQAGRKRTAG